MIAKKQEEARQRMLDKDREREEYILAVRKRIGMENEPRTFEKDMVCLYWECFFPIL